MTTRQYIKAILKVAGRSLRMSPSMAIVQALDSIIGATLPILTTYLAALTTISLAKAYAGEHGSGDQVLLYVVITAALGVVTMFWNSVSSYVSLKTRYKIQAQIEDEMIQQFTTLPFATYDDKRIVDLHDKAERFSYMFGYVFNTFGSIVSSMVGAIGAIIALLIISPWLSLIVMISVVPGIIIQIKLARDQTKHWDNTMTNRRRKSEIKWSMMRPEMIAEMRIYGVIKHLIANFAMLRDQDDKERLDFELKTVWKSLAADIGTALVELGSLIWVTLQIAAREQPVGQFLYVQQMVSRAMGQASSLASQLGRVDEDLANLVHYQEFMELDAGENGGVNVGSLDDRITIDNLSFAYPGTSKPVIENISMEIKRGTRVAIVGENGAGKSTLIKLIMGLYRPSEGSILIDGRDLSKVNSASWHRHISLLSQNFASYTFATMRENITLGNVKVRSSNKSIQAAVDMAEFKEVADSHPRGLDTYIERWLADDVDPTTATQLSGGQLQRLALARNFYRNAPVVILDEPTSAIDALAESRIFKRLFEQKDKTVIIISHRLSTVERADNIYMLEDGKVVEVGTHRELIALRGRYYRMFESQLISDFN